MKIEREKLKDRWLNILTPEQRGAWSRYVSSAPNWFASDILLDRTGQEMFIACNLPNKK